jgi:hypothetical protein
MKPAMGGSRDGCNGALGTLQLNMSAWNQKLTKYVKDVNNLEMQYNFLFKCNKEGMSLNKFTFVQVMKACTSLRALEDGKLVHEQLIQVGASLLSL